MSYQVIARKWRPQTFEEVTGQEIITHTLRNAVEHDRLHHAYLFSGARGVGKTTTARLLAKALNCHSSAKPVAKPCNECHSCHEIAEGRSIDVLEFDAASNTQVDKIRDLIIENINISPARDRFKVFIIDEVHMLSNSSFNALLKTLEEPPPNVVFVMATTELHKVPDTILSRCQEFEFRTIATSKIFERLNIIADAENVTVTAEALREIARSGEGSMRDAQSNLDQVISFSEGTIDIEDVVNALGIASAETLTRTIEAIAHRRPEEGLLVVEDLIRRGQDLRNFCRDLMAFLRDLLVAKVTNHADGLLDSAIFDQDALIKYAEHFSESDLVRLFNSLAETEIQIKNASQPRYVLEVGLVKLMEIQRVTAIEQILERLAKLQNEPPSEEKKTLNDARQTDFRPKIEESDFEAQNEYSKSDPTDSKSKGRSPKDFQFDEIPFPVHNQTADQDLDGPETTESERSRIIESERTPFITQEFLSNISIRVPEISAEDLEHVEDPKLDAAYESRLLREGDDLKVIKNASKLLEGVLPDAVETPSRSGNGTAVAPTRAKPNADYLIPVFSTEKESALPPALPENPTEEELWRHAENHPAVRRVLRIFRGKIISVQKASE